MSELIKSHFGRISLLLVLVMTLSACAPVTRAQGLDTTAHAELQGGLGVAGVRAGDAASLYRLYTPQVTRVAQAPATPPEPRAWFDLSLQPQLIQRFNQTAHARDIARIEHISMLDLLDQVTVGRKLVIFKNLVDAEELLPFFADRMDIIGYNLEGGPANLPEEQADPVAAVRQMRNLADAYGLKVALGPNRNFALSHGAAMAPYVDLFVLQVQRVQTEHDTVREFVFPLMEDLLAANPDLEISVQLRTEGDVDRLVELVDSLGPDLAGVSILTSQDTLPTANALIAAIDEWRYRAPAATPLPRATPDAGPVLTSTPGSEPRRTPTATPEPAPARPIYPDGPTRWFLFGSGLLFGILLTMLGGTWLIYAARRTQTP